MLPDQLSPENFAYRRARQRLTELYLHWNLIVDQRLFTVRDHLFDR
jgi:hypothetical protein